MTRTELIVRTHERLPEMTLEQVMSCCGALLESIGDALVTGHSVTLPKLGEFRIKQHKTRGGYDACSGKERTIPSCKVVKFYPHQSLKDRLNARVKETTIPC